MMNEADNKDKKGIWLEYGGGLWECSNCNYVVEGWNNTSYCPNCNAYMRIGDENYDKSRKKA